MVKRGSRVKLHVSRPARIVLQDVRARLNTLECILANVSTTGAMLRTRAAVAIDREIPLIIELAPKPATVQVRVVRCEPTDVELPGAIWRRQQDASPHASALLVPFTPEERVMTLDRAIVEGR